MRCIQELENHLRSLNQCYSQAPVFPIRCDVDYCSFRNCNGVRFYFQNPDHNILIELSCLDFLNASNALVGSSLAHLRSSLAIPIVIAAEAFWPILSEAPRHERIAVMPELPSFSFNEGLEGTVQELQCEVIEVHRDWLGLRRAYRTKDDLYSFFHSCFDRSYLNDALAGRPTIDCGTTVSHVFHGTFENDIEPIAEEVKKKAWALFKSHLTTEQLHDFKITKSITCIGNKTGNFYKINCDGRRNFNITKNNDTLCFQTKGDLPLGDFYLAQKLAIECNEDEVLRVCNWLVSSLNEAGGFDYAMLSKLRSYLLMWFCTANIIICAMSILKIWGIM